MQTSSEEDIKYIRQQLEELSSTMSGLIELNQSLVKQNLKLSTQLSGKVKDPEPVSPKEKELFYYEKGEGIYVIHGSGTYDNREQIKKLNGTWDKEIKGWQVICTLNQIKEIFPSISESNNNIDTHDQVDFHD